jgi:hypothetical protein
VVDRDGEAGVAEDVHHPVVAVERVGRKGLDLRRPGRLGQQFDQPGAETSALECIADHHSAFRDTLVLGMAHVIGYPKDDAAGLRDDGEAGGCPGRVEIWQ